MPSSPAKLLSSSSAEWQQKPQTNFGVFFWCVHGVSGPFAVYFEAVDKGKTLSSPRSQIEKQSKSKSNFIHRIKTGSTLLSVDWDCRPACIQKGSNTILCDQKACRSGLLRRCVFHGRSLLGSMAAGSESQEKAVTELFQFQLVEGP